MDKQQNYMRALRFLPLAFCASFAGPFARSGMDGAPTAVDSLLRGKDYRLESVDTTKRTRSGDVSHLVKESAKVETKGDGLWMIQFDAMADFDAAQRRRGDLQARTGYAIQLVFDAPFYKLRAGGWNSKEQAEDRVAELSSRNITAFTVKIR